MRCHGYHVKIFTETAAGANDGTTTLFRDTVYGERMNEWAASLQNWMNSSSSSDTSKIKSIQLARFLQTRIFNQLQYFPKGFDGPVVMKLDIEGSEYDVLPQLITSGALCAIDALFLEWHPHMAKSGLDVTKIQSFYHLFSELNACGSELINLDDESYGTNSSQIPLVKCSGRQSF